MTSPTPPLPDVPIGARVVVRYLIEEGERATDAVGELVARDADALTVETRRGPVRIPVVDVVVSKPIAAAPARWRVASFLRRASVAVLDLDGVLRTHDTAGATATAEAELGLSTGALIELALTLPEATAALQGQVPYAAWADALHSRLVADGHTEDAARAAVAHWSSDHGTPVAETVELVDRLEASGIPVLIFTNGTDRLPLEMESCGLDELTPALLNSADLGAAKPCQKAYAAAHAEMERRLGRTVGRGEVHFTDDRPANVDAARVFGWQARVFTLP